MKQKMFENDKPPVKILVIGLLGLIALLGLNDFGLRSLLKYETSREIHSKQLGPSNPELQELRAKDSASLTEYEQLDKDKGIYQIPVTEAMEILVQNPALIQSQGGATKP